MKTPKYDVTVKSMRTGNSIRTLQVAPGEFMAPDPKVDEVPRFGIYKLVPDGRGGFRPVFDCTPQRVRLSRDLPRQLGLSITQATLKVLCAGGFVESSRPTPRVILIDLGSLCKHLEAAEDPAFWTEAKLKQYSDAKAMVSASGNHALVDEEDDV